jgi:hypothetical protein
MAGGGFMDTTSIIEKIDQEIARLQQAKAALNGVDAPRKAGRPKTTEKTSTATSVKSVKRAMSVEGKARIAAAQKKRWAKMKRAAKKAANAVIAAA